MVVFGIHSQLISLRTLSCPQRNKLAMYLEARNTTSHIYNSDQAEKVFNAIQGFAAHAEALLEALKQQCQ